MYEYQSVRVEVDSRGAATMYIRWPDGVRASIRQFHTDFPLALQELRDDDNVRLVVIRGAGEKYFLSVFAGVEDGIGPIDDVEKGVATKLDNAFTTIRETREIIDGITQMEKPVIAMVNGDALGIGATVAFACDLIIADEAAYLTDTHMASYYFASNADPSAGIVAGDGGAAFWPLSMSMHLAKEYLFTARPVKARELADLRAINRAVPREELQAEVDKMVDLLLARPAWALGWTKIAMNKHVRQGVEMTLDVGLALELITLQTRQRLTDGKGTTHI